MISKQPEASYRANQLTCLTSISIHRSCFLRNGQGGRPRTCSRMRRQRPRRAVASVINAVTTNLHASFMKFGLIGRTPMTWYSEISSRMLSIPTGTALAGIDNFCDFTSKSAQIQGKSRKHAQRRDATFLKNQDKAFKHHHYHHLFFRDRFYCV